MKRLGDLRAAWAAKKKKYMYSDASFQFDASKWSIIYTAWPRVCKESLPRYRIMHQALLCSFHCNLFAFKTKDLQASSFSEYNERSGSPRPVESLWQQQNSPSWAKKSRGLASLRLAFQTKRARMMSAGFVVPEKRDDPRCPLIYHVLGVPRAGRGFHPNATFHALLGFGVGVLGSDLIWEASSYGCQKYRRIKGWLF